MTPETQAFISAQPYRDEPIAEWVAAYIEHPEPHPHELATCTMCGVVWEPELRPSGGPVSAFCSRKCRNAHYEQQRWRKALDQGQLNAPGPETPRTPCAAGNQQPKEVQ